MPASSLASPTLHLSMHLCQSYYVARYFLKPTSFLSIKDPPSLHPAQYLGHFRMPQSPWASPHQHPLLDQGRLAAVLRTHPELAGLPPGQPNHQSIWTEAWPRWCCIRNALCLTWQTAPVSLQPFILARETFAWTITQVVLFPCRSSCKRARMHNRWPLGLRSFRWCCYRCTGSTFD